MALIFDVFICGIILLITVIFYFKHAFLYWKKNGIRNLPPSIPFGNASELFLAKKCIGEVVANLYEKFKKQGIKYGGYYMLTKPVFLAICPELVQKITVTDFSYFRERGMHYDEKVDPLSTHLFSIRNPKWHELRTKFSPMFTLLKLKNMVPIIRNCGEELENILGECAQNGETVNIRDVSDRFTTDIIASVAFGMECNSLRNPNAELRKFGQKFFELTFRNSLVLSLSLLAPKILKFFKIPVCEPKKAKYFFNIINYTVETREKYNIERNDMLNLLIRLKNNKSIEDVDGMDSVKPVTSITFNELASQSFLFYLAGFETSATTLSFAAFELAQNQEIQARLRHEIVEVLKKNGGDVEYETIGEMIFLDQVVKETLRKYPPIPILNRECTEDYTISGTKTTIRKGTSVVISILGMHRDPVIYENPELFDPERFNPERKQKIASSTYVPFGIGPRNCIGLRLAQLEVKIGLIYLLKNYKIEMDSRRTLPSKLSPKCFIIAFNDNIWLKIKKIE